MPHASGHGRRILTLILTVCTVGVTFFMPMLPTAVPESPNHTRTLDAATTDLIAHAMGTEWHGPGPQVVDFGPVDPAAPVAGMDQWLANKATAAPRAASSRDAVTDKRKLLVIRVAFSGQTTQRFTDAELMTQWFDPMNVLFTNMSNGNFKGWDVTIVPQVTLSTPRSTYVVVDSAGADALYNDDTSNIQTLINATLAASTKSTLEPLIEAADTVLILATNANAARIRAFNSYQRTFMFAAPDVPDVKNMVFLDEGGTRDTQLQWGAMAHEMAHALQAYSGSSDWDIGHPSNYSSNFELLDANYPGHVGAYLKGVTMASWQPSGQTISISSDGKSQSDSYCLNPIELDYHSNPTPQILKINI
ncbi:MAG: hypothetical protein RLY87_1713, partial [Chloroflexota bacterium]